MLLDGAHKQRGIMCLCVFGHRNMVETHQSAGGREGGSLSTDRWKEEGKERRKETGREMELHTMPAALL